MAQEFPNPPGPPGPVEQYPVPPGVPPRRDNRTLWIVIAIVVVLLCCCCLVAAAVYAYQNGDRWFDFTQVLRLLL